MSRRGRAALDNAAFDAATRAGEQMGLEPMIAEALHAVGSLACTLT